MSDYNKDDIKNTEDEPKYEDICYMCRRPESKTGRMLHIPNMNNMCICIDCMERSFRVMDGSNYADLMQGMNIQDLFPGGMNMDDMMNVQNQIPKRQKLKKKVKDDEKVQPEFVRLHLFALDFIVLHAPKAPLSGADSPYQGEMSRRDKRGRDAGSAQPRLRGCRRFA